MANATFNVLTIVRDEALKKLASTLEGITKVAQSVKAKLKESADGAAEATKKAEATRKEVMIQAANVSQLYMGLRSAVSGLQSVFGSYVESYNNAATASKKLEVIMRQRMDATDEDIKSIKEVTNAQKELGIISGSVQNAGAQQVGTFVTQASTLRTLIPAMNNLLAQQKGVNATQEDAVGIGNLMGKAMQGQTSALRRVGITFSEAEEKILKYGTESERAATLAQVITNNVGEMNAELAKTDAGRMKQLQNYFGGIKAKIGGLVVAITPYLAALSQVALLVATFGQLKAVMVAAGATVKAFALNMWGSIKATLAAIVSSSTFGKVQTYLAAQLNISAAAAKGLTLALGGIMAATGIGLVIWGLTAAISAFSSAADKAAGSAKGLSSEQQIAKDAEQAYIDASAKARQEATKLQETFDRLRKKKQLSASESRELQGALGSLRGMFGDLASGITTAAGAYELLTRNVMAYAEAAGIKAEIESVSRAKAQAEAERDLLDPEGARERNLVRKEGKLGAALRLNAEKSATADKYRDTPDRAPKLKLPRVGELDMAIKAADNKLAILKEKLENNPLKGVEPTAPTTPSGRSGGGHRSKGETAEQRRQKEIKAEKEANDRRYKLADELESYKEKQEQDRIKRSFEKRQATIALMAAGAEKELAQNRLNYDKELQAEKDYQREQLKQRQAHLDKLWELDPQNKDAVARGKRNPTRLTERDIPATEKIASHLRQQQKEKAYQQANAATAKEYAAPARLEELRTIDELSKAVSYYQDASNKQSGAELYNTQRTIAAHEEKLAKLRETGDLFRELQDAAAAQKLSDKELRIKVRAIGYEELTERIKRLQKRLTDTDNPVGEAQRKDLESLIGTYSEWRKKSVDSLGAVKSAWSGAQGIGDGINGMIDAINGNSSAWQKLTAVLNGFFGVIDGFNSVLAIVKQFAAVSQATAVAKGVETAATLTNASAVGTEATAVVAASAAKIAANKAEASSAVAAAAGKTFATHSAIPFAGIGIAAGLVAAMIGTMLALPKFADGGIAYGPTLGLFGEYAGASHNPEVVAPLNKLRDLIQPQGGMGGRVEFRIEGRHLVGVLNKEARHAARNY